MVYDSAKYAAENAKSSIDKMMLEVESVRAELAKIKTDIGGGVQPMQPYPWQKSMRPKSYHAPAEARAHLTALYEASKPIGEQNEIAAKRNRELTSAAIAYLKALGIPETYRKLKSSRSYKYTSVDCEWKQALLASVPTSSGWTSVQQAHDAAMKEIAEWEKQEERANAMAQSQREAKQKQENYIKTAAAMAARYGLPVTAAADEVFDKVIESDKYLYLAHWLMRNRGDWSEGPHLARIGFDKFTVEDDIDRQVAAEIGSLISDWDGDGRCFRDCAWNYSKLFEIAVERTPQAVKDYETLSELKPSDY